MSKVIIKSKDGTVNVQVHLTRNHEFDWTLLVLRPLFVRLKLMAMICWHAMKIERLKIVQKESCKSPTLM